MTNVLPLTLLLLVSGLAAGCSPLQPKVTSESEPAIRLAATLITPTDIALEWSGKTTNAAGLIVEFATEPNGEYTTIQFLPPNQPRFTHPNLLPGTTFYYRVRAYYGPASNQVDLILPEPPPGEDLDKHDHAWIQPQTLPQSARVTKQPIRGANAVGGAPTELTATVMHSSGVRFTWTDHAGDEEGYLLEIKPRGSPEFSVAAVLDPDINSFGIITLPHEKRWSFRVRAFYYGKPSNLAHQTTGREPAPAS